MASQEQLILAQLGAESADIFKEEVDTGSGLVQDLQAGVMGAKAFDEAVYAVKGKLGISEKGFESDYMSNKFKQDSLLGKVGRKMFGMSDISQVDTGITSESEDVLGDFPMEDLVNDFESSTSNVELSPGGEMITRPFDVKRHVVGPALKTDNSRNTSFVGPVGMVSDSELEDIYDTKPSSDLLSSNYSTQYSLSQNNQLPESVREDISSMPSGYFNLMDEQVKDNYGNFLTKDRTNALIEFGETFGYGNGIPQVQNAFDVFSKKFNEKKGY
jgi:hypothetical protein